MKITKSKMLVLATTTTNAGGERVNVHKSTVHEKIRCVKENRLI